jgi:dihydroorotase
MPEGAAGWVLPVVRPAHAHTHALALRSPAAALFDGGLRPHAYCLPILKSEVDRQALLAAVASGSPKFFLGTDSAPHPKASKECACGAAGMYTAHAALELYAAAFAEAGALHHLRAFACEHGADFYGLPRNADRAGWSGKRVVLRAEPWVVPASYAFGGDGGVVVPAMAGQTLPWKASLEEGAVAAAAV